MSDQIIDITRIMSLIPHRYPFLLVDKIIEFKLNNSIIGIKNVSFNEPQFMGHFPSNPVMPGVLIIEAMAQTSAILVAQSMDSVTDKEVYFMSIENAKFRKIVKPGDTLYIYSRIEQQRAQVWKFVATAKVNNTVVAESNFTAMVKNKGAK